MKYIKNGTNYDVGPMRFTLDDLERLKVKVTNGPVTAIGMWGYMPDRITGVLVSLLSENQSFVIITLCGFGSRNLRDEDFGGGQGHSPLS